MHFLYEDHVLPYVSDARHAPDTVFFVCEEDFRMYERDEAIGPSEVARSAAELASGEPFAPGERPLLNWLSELYARRLRQTPLVGADVAAEINVPSGEDLGQRAGLVFPAPLKTLGCRSASRDFPGVL